MQHNIRRIRRLLTPKATQVLIQAMVVSRFDYSNSLLAGLPAIANDLFSSATMQQPNWSSIHLESPTLLRCPHPFTNVGICVPCGKPIRSSLHPERGQTVLPRTLIPLCIRQSACCSLTVYCSGS